MQRGVDWAAQFHSNIPAVVKLASCNSEELRSARATDDILKDLQGLRSPHRQQKKSIHELAAALRIGILFVGLLPTRAPAERVEADFAKILRVVMRAGNHGIQATGQAIDGRFKGWIIVIREDDAEGSIELGAC
jgi:hypothetical protein